MRANCWMASGRLLPVGSRQGKMQGGRINAHRCMQVKISARRREVKQMLAKRYGDMPSGDAQMAVAEKLKPAPAAW
jgi:hypothetical protein